MKSNIANVRKSPCATEIVLSAEEVANPLYQITVSSNRESWLLIFCKAVLVIGKEIKVKINSRGKHSWSSDERCSDLMHPTPSPKKQTINIMF